MQYKCTELILELNHCVEASPFACSSHKASMTIAHPPSSSHCELTFQEVLRANAHVKTAADLASKYRKNVQYNLEAIREGGLTSTS